MPCCVGIVFVMLNNVFCLIAFFVSVRFKNMDNGHLQIRGMKKTDEGMYTCEARVMARGEIDFRMIKVIVNGKQCTCQCFWMSLTTLDMFSKILSNVWSIYIFSYLLYTLAQSGAVKTLFMFGLKHQSCLTDGHSGAVRKK